MKQKGLTTFTTAVASSVLLLLAMVVWNGLQPATQQTALFDPPVVQAQEVPLPAAIYIAGVEGEDGTLQEGDTIAFGDRITATVEITVDITAGESDPVLPPVRVGDEIRVWAGTEAGPFPNGTMETFVMDEAATTPGATQPSESGNAQITWEDWQVDTENGEWVLQYYISFGYSQAGDALFASWTSDVYIPAPIVSDPFGLDSRTGVDIIAPDDFRLNCELLPIAAGETNPDAATITPTLNVVKPTNTGDVSKTVTMSVIDHNGEAVDDAMSSLSEPGIPVDDVADTYDLTNFDPGVTYTVQADVYFLDSDVYGTPLLYETVTDTFEVDEIPSEFCAGGPMVPDTAAVTGVMVMPEDTQLISNTTQVVTAEVSLEDTASSALELGQTVPVTFSVLDTLSTIDGSNDRQTLATVIEVDGAGATAVATATVEMAAGGVLGLTNIQAESGGFYDVAAVEIVDTMFDVDVWDVSAVDAEALLNGEEISGTTASGDYEIVLPGDLRDFMPEGVVGVKIELINLLTQSDVSALADSTGLASLGDRSLLLNYVFRIRLEVLLDPTDENSPTMVMFWVGTYPGGDTTEPLGSLAAPGIRIQTAYSTNPTIEVRAVFSYFAYLSEVPSSLSLAQVDASWRSGDNTNTIQNVTVGTPDPGGTVQNGNRVFRQENLSGTEFSLTADNELDIYMPYIGQNFSTTPTTSTLTLR